jgi:hypothetical protein
LAGSGGSGARAGEWPAFIGARGREEGQGVAQRREVRPGQGRDMSAASPACRGSTIGNRQLRGTCAPGMGGFGVGEIGGAQTWSRPVGVRALARLRAQASPPRWPAASSRDGTEQGSGGM